jgi:hypothetical protein
MPAGIPFLPVHWGNSRSRLPDTTASNIFKPARSTDIPRISNDESTFMPTKGLKMHTPFAGDGHAEFTFRVTKEGRTFPRGFRQSIFNHEGSGFGFRHGEILKRLQIRSQTHPVALMCERLSNAISRHAISLVLSSGENFPRDVRSTAE